MKKQKKDEQRLITLVEIMLPKAKEMMQVEGDCVMLHQDAFAADYQPDEYLLLGAFIKYCGLKGKEVRIIGKNRETLWSSKEKRKK